MPNGPRIPQLRSRGEDVAEIASSRLFDAGHYSRQRGVKRATASVLARHYLGQGERSGVTPSPLFDPSWYRQQNPDVAGYRNLLLHFLRFGDEESRSPHPLFLPAYYVRKASSHVERPLADYLDSRGQSGRDPHPLFDTQAFLASLSNPLREDETPLERFLEDPTQDAFLAPVFTASHYAASREEAFDARKHNLVEFLRHASSENVSPHPGFDVSYYLDTNPDVRHAHTNAYLHFLLTGRSEGRRPHPFDGSLLARAASPEFVYSPRPEQLEDRFTGTYRPTRFRPTALTAAPQPLAAPPIEVSGSSIHQREQANRLDVSARFRLDWGTPQQEDIAGPTISVLVPVYRAPLLFLDRAIRSVMQQSYTNWELCLVDDGSRSEALATLLEDYASSDPRIKVAVAKKNGGISRATNAALSLATGEFIALLDQDDMLTVDALEKVAEALVEDPALDLVYSDECTLDVLDTPLALFPKPDWSPLFLLSTMYTGHLSVYRKQLVERVGGFRPPFDFSQDYDLALRVAETSPHVRHLHDFLYGWRSIPGSAAQGGKPLARNTNLAALQDALDRRGLAAGALGHPTSNVVSRAPRSRSESVSLIIPSDNADNITTAVKSLRARTSYQQIEVVVVTNSAVVKRLKRVAELGPVTWVRYDKPFNFSDKCNEGARRAAGTHLVFYNDDVHVISDNWLEVLLDAAAVDGVGAVGPKLLYEDGTIQHAGMVVGVRRLVGTAFHALPRDTSQGFGMAQYAREVSLLCGACLLVPADVFWKVGGFDATNVPVNHSDVDLCLRIRALGLSCYYTPFAALEHTGHASLAEVDEAAVAAKTVVRDKANLFLLKRWSRELADDPYFPAPMRDLHFHDSQEPFRLFPGDRDPLRVTAGSDVLLVSHDLSASGAPRIVLDLARVLVEAGCYVCVSSPTDGPVREQLTALGVDVVVDSLLLTRNSSVHDFAVDFDFAIANTVVAWPFVAQLGAMLDTYWYVHESELIDHLVGLDEAFLHSFPLAAGIWAGSPMSQRKLHQQGVEDVTVVPYGVRDDPAGRQGTDRRRAKDRPLVVGLFGSFEPRKGHDLAVLGVLALPKAMRDRVSLRLFGRVLDKHFAEAVLAIAGDSPQIIVGNELTADEYRRQLGDVDVVIVPSRDDTLPLVSLDALSLGKLLVVSRATGTAELLPDALQQFVLEHNSPQEIADVLQLVLACDLEEIASRSRDCFLDQFSWQSFAHRVLALLPMETGTVDLRSMTDRAYGLRRGRRPRKA